MSAILVRLGMRSAGIALAPGMLVLSSAAVADVLYSYDLNGRVTTALYDNGTCVVYTYDANGNRLSQTTYPPGSLGSATWGSGTFGCFKWTS